MYCERMRTVCVSAVMNCVCVFRAVAPVLAYALFIGLQFSSDQLAKIRFKNFADLLNRRIKLCVFICVYTIVCVHVSVANQSKSTRIYSPVKQREPSASTLRSSFGPKGGRQFNEIPFPLLFLCSSSLTFDATHLCSPAHINICVCVCK